MGAPLSAMARDVPSLAISAVWWLPVYPVWSLIYISIGILVIYGLVAYGGHGSARAA